MTGIRSAFITAFLAVGPVIAFGAAIANQENTPVVPECVQACSHLASIFGPDAYSLGNANVTLWDTKQQETHSACWVQPSSTEDVSAILDVIITTSCRFAVKGGGHARDPDDSVSPGGVTIDMQKMRSVEVSPDQKTAKVGSGHVLLSLYQGLEKYNLTTLGGRVADVGLGGYALGGGFSHLSSKYGLAMDNIFEYEIVLPNATIAIVNQETHPDLYFALRGGMNNFGIVTHFTMKAVRQGQMFGGSRAYTADQRDAILEQAYELTTSWKNDTNMAFYYDYGYDQERDDFTIAVSPEYSLPVLNPAPFKQLNQIPFERSTLRLDRTSQFSIEVASATPPGGRNLFATVTYSPSADLDRHIQDIMAQEIQPLKKAPGFFPNLVIQPLQVQNRDPMLSLQGRLYAKHSTVALLTVRWQQAEDDDRMNAFAAEWVKRATAATKDAGKHNPWLYINYASKGQDPFLGYGEANRQRLRRIQREVDPQGVFTSDGLCRGYFKLQ
ncbi:FAD binding domain protein [Aspergillus bombycis]|uniref:FAD binding domain protein n=1 Tax=Aspergillus bombycis TaxID=109264 RepID=A0A1F7ZXU7_9EURO|nr:FAD binding domain protein [Aspergillus bombycis]OGM43868.1 FAD binding domain protein [Aspergillus bombycis]